MADEPNKPDDEMRERPRRVLVRKLTEEEREAPRSGSRRTQGCQPTVEVTPREPRPCWSSALSRLCWGVRASRRRVCRVCPP